MIQHFHFLLLDNTLSHCILTDSSDIRTMVQSLRTDTNNRRVNTFIPVEWIDDKLSDVYVIRDSINRPLMGQNVACVLCDVHRIHNASSLLVRDSILLLFRP